MVEANKRPPVNKVETVHLQDFSGGLNSTISGSLLNINEAQVAKDMSLEQKGTIIPRNGRTKRYALPFSDSPIVGLGMLFKQDGTSHLIAASDDKLYSDAPRISEKWQHREDWELGAANQFVDYGREDGSLMLKAGNERVVSDWETAATAGTANSTYGYKFKTLKDVKLYKVFWTPKKLSSTYTITLWNNEGTGIWTNNVEIGAEDTDLIDVEQTIDFYTSPMLLEKDKEYTISIQCDLAEAVIEYTPATEPVVNGLVTHEGAFKKEGEYGFPDTAVAGKSFYNVDLGFELRDYVIDVQEKTSMDEGTYTNISYETPSEIVITGLDTAVDCSTLEEYDHIRLDIDSILPATPDDVTVGYKVQYDGANWSPEFTFNGKMADFSISKYDKAVSKFVKITSISSPTQTITATPKIRVCGKSGLTHERESASNQEDTTTGKSTGTLDNVEVATDTDEVIQLTKQGIDKTDSVDLTLGTHTNTELDAGEVKLQVDPNAQGVTPLTGYLNAKKFTIDRNVFDANEINYPVMAKLYQDSNAPAWSSTGSYVEGDVVIHNNHYYKKSNTAGNAEPHVGTNWFLDWYWQGLNFDFTKIQSDGKDIRFTASDGSTLLDYERELLETIDEPKGLSFDGVDDYVNFGDNSTFDFGTNTFKIEMEFVVKGITGNNQMLFCKRFSNTSGGKQYYVMIYNNLSVCFMTYDEEISDIISSINEIEIGKRHTLIAERKSTGEMILTLDGTIIAQQTLTIRDVSNDGECWIGNDNRDFNKPLNGKIFDTKVSENGTLIAEYNFDEGTGTALTDSVETNDGNINGATWVDAQNYSQAVFHVRIPSVSSSADTDYYMYYNNPDETVDGENATGVWDSNFVMVQHMGSSLADSTINGNDGTNYGSTVVDGLNGKARSFDGVDDYILVTQNASLNNAHYTYTFVNKLNVPLSSQSKDFPMIFYKRGATVGNALYYSKPYSQVQQSFGYGSGLNYGHYIIDYDTTDYMVTSITHDGTSGKLYNLGVLKDEIVSAHSAGTENITIGNGSSNPVNGTIDEVRISNIARSDAWIKADDYNLRRWELYSNIEEVNFEEYYDTGSYETEVLDFSAVVEEITSEDFLSMIYTEPDDSTLTVYVRTSQDNVTWTAYSEVTTPTIPYAPYMQFRADFTNSTDRLSTPTLSEITVGYKTAYHHSGTWESSVFDLLDTNHMDSILHVFNNLPTGTGVTVEVAVSDDNVTFSAWTTIADGDSLPVNRYLKFKVTLTPNTTLDVTPQHIGLKYFVSKLFKSDVGTYESPVYPIEDYLQETSLFELIDKLTSGDTSVSVEMARSYNNSVWEPYVPVTVDSELPQTDYYIKFKITTNVSTDKTKAPILDGFKVTLDNVELRPVWTSDVKDISESKDLGSGRLVSDYINSSGALAVLSRSSPNGIDTWSDWEHIDVDGNLMSPPNNYVQAKVIFVGLKSELKELTLSMDGPPEAEVLASGLTTGATYSFTTLRDTLIIANGKDEMKKWDGLTATIETLGGGIAPMKIVTTHHNRVWGVDAENPSRVRYSNILDPETWGAFDFIDFNPEDGDYITAMIRYGQNLLISKKRSMALLTGNKTSNYNVSWLDSEAGCTGQYAITQGGKYICYVAQDGIRFTDLADSAVATERLIPHWDTINKRKLTQASMVYWRNKLFVSLPSEGSLTNNQVWVYDFLRNAWTINTGWEISNWLKFNQYGEDVLIGGSSEKGQTYVVDVTRYDDNDIIEYEWKSKDFNFDYAERYKLFRNIYLDLEGTPSESTLYVDLYVDGVLKGTYTTVIPAGNEAKHTRRVLPPLYNAVLGRMLTIGLRGRCGVQGITIEYVVRGAVPSGNL
jgi:hypothetical protein